MNNSHPDIDRLIALYLSQKASADEKEALEKWINTSAENKAVFTHLHDAWLSTSETPLAPEKIKLRDQIWHNGITENSKTKYAIHREIDLGYWSKIAAIFIFLLMGVGVFSFLVYNNTTSQITESLAWVKVENPNGRRTVHMLPDGTKVWLNSASSLSYPEKFSDSVRSTKLMGEAFFEVAKNKEKPFIVETADTRTQVLGTSFNIFSYPQNDTVRIALLEGKVKVQSSDHIQTAILSPGEELITSRDNTLFYRRAFDYVATFGWKEGILNFDGTGFYDFCQAIERWYGVQVKFEGKPPVDWQIRARYQNEDLRHVLRDITFNKNINFTLTKDTVLLTF
ncbi:transmembrane sensor [Catalinimonas alkaloidigena]|uniref:FecR family protein n=1 Tax=Catalinimonas alkaloidigena TaxID=1075417 RepID=UPI002405CA2C|nr:FecR family protein [Catalinimonas alkaloidigena]MDF9796418.1 transmembrane sensor [Catalinimonas alkaloidigena]